MNRTYLKGLAEMPAIKEPKDEDETLSGSAAARAVARDAGSDASERKRRLARAGRWFVYAKAADHGNSIDGPVRPGTLRAGGNFREPDPR